MNDTRTARGKRTGPFHSGEEEGTGEDAVDGEARGAICGHCGQDMLTATSCAPGTLVIAGRRFARSRQTVLGPAGHCGDCGILDGGIHHLGCDLERCPCCRQQLISCGCLDGGFRLEGRHDQ